MKQNCPDCTRLWEAYKTAVFALQKIKSKFQIAVFSHNDAVLKEISPAVNAAIKRREELSADIFRHETAEHSVLAFADGLINAPLVLP